MVRSIPQLDALRDEWDVLSARCRNPLLEHDWFVSCAEAFHASDDLAVLTCSEGGRLTGVAPLVRSGRHLLLLGASTLHEPSGWIHESPAALAELLHRAMREDLPMLLQRVAADSPLCAGLADLPRRSGLTVVRRAPPSLAVPVGPSWPAYYDGLPGLIRGNLRRLRRKAERDLGAMQVRFLRPRHDEVDDLLETFAAVEGSGWKGRQGSSLQARPDLRDFFRRYGRRAAARGRLRVAVLQFGARVGAVEIAVEAYRRVWQLKIGYADALSRYYPGLHLTEASIRRAFDDGLDAYEFLGSAEPWEERWRAQPRQYRLLAVYPTSIRGATGACRDAAGMAWHRFRGALSPRRHGDA